jgi:hypothetical protein
MRIVFFSDEKYLHVVRNFITSCIPVCQEYDFTFYSVNFYRKDLFKEFVFKIDVKHWTCNTNLPNPNFYKPSILLKTLDDYPGENDFCFIDSDIVLGKRFDASKMIGDKKFELPLSPFGPFELPYTYRTYSDGTQENFTPDLLMKYFNVPEKTMRYVQNCLILYKRSHYDFLLEWESMCLNRFLLREHWRYYSFQDETAFNVMLWKYKASETLGHIFVNTHKFSTFRMVEETSLNQTPIENNPYEYCHDSSRVMFYHGTKDKEQNILIQKYINENYTSNTRASSHTS